MNSTSFGEHREGDKFSYVWEDFAGCETRLSQRLFSLCSGWVGDINKSYKKQNYFTTILAI